MFCPECGSRVVDDAAFCSTCGARLAPVDPQPIATYGAGLPPVPPPLPPAGGGRRRILWVALAVLLAILVLGGVAVAALVATRDGDTPTTVVEATTTTSPPPSPSTSTVPPLETTSTTVAPAGALPGQDGGRWVEVSVPDPPGEVGSVALSEDLVVMGSDAGLFAYLFGGDVVVPIPRVLSGHALPDAEGRLVVWWGFEFDETAGGFADEAVFAMRVPDGEVIRVSRDPGEVSYPQIAAGLVTWSEPRPSRENPDEVYDQPIYGVGVDRDGSPQQDPQLLVDSASAYVLGDSSWQYSLSDRYLAWEVHSDSGDVPPGSYVLDLERNEVIELPPGSWRPSVAGEVVAFFSEAGLQAMDLTDSSTSVIDPAGDWPVVAETFVTYMRGVEDADGVGWDIVTRGLGDTGVEQVLGSQVTPPYLSPSLAAAPTRIAYVTDTGGVRVFEWEPR